MTHTLCPEGTWRPERPRFSMPGDSAPAKALIRPTLRRIGEIGAGGAGRFRPGPFSIASTALLTLVLILVVACRPADGRQAAVTSPTEAANRYATPVPVSPTPVGDLATEAATSASPTASLVAGPTASLVASPTASAVTATPQSVAPTPTAATTPAAAPAVANAPLSPVATPTSPAASTGSLSPECAVKSITPLDAVAARQWAEANDVNAGVATRQDSAGVWQVYVSQSGGKEVCISCKTVPGGPRADRNKRYARWDPNHEWIIVTAEMDDHPPYRGGALGKRTAMGNGYWMNFYATTPDGSKWYQLTHYNADNYRSNPLDVEAAFDPKFSRDGTRIVWTHHTGPPDTTTGARRSYWELWMAEYVKDANGVPHLEHALNITPKSPVGHWFEPHEFSPDDTKLLLASDMGIPRLIAQDIFTIDVSGINLATGEIKNEVVTDLTNSPDQWDEHAFYSPNGKLITWISSSPFSASGPVENNNVRTELMLMNADGSGKVQLTHFNTPSGYRESTPGYRSIANVPVWSKDGTQIRIGVGFAPTDQEPSPVWLNTTVGGKIWLVTFQGKCGG